MEKRRVYFENLDGLRFLCFLSVFFFHSFYTENAAIKDSAVYKFVKWDLAGNGSLGVNFFFVLSGFLITYLLLEEKQQNGSINLKTFWLRRILRIWPLFYFCVFFGFYAFPFFKQLFGQAPSETAHLPSYLVFLNNFDVIKNGLPDASVLGVLWSVAIEEQFYLFWPLVIFAIPIRNLWIPFAVILAASVVFRAFNSNILVLEIHTLSCIGDMVVGATAAWLLAVSAGFRKSIENLPGPVIGLVYLAFFIIFFFKKELFYITPLIAVERLVIAILICLIILEQNFCRNSLFKISRFRLISKLGLLTYGLYCLHFIGILITTNLTKKLGFNTQLWQVIILETSIALLLTILFAWLSYRYFEKPFLNLKNKYSTVYK